MIGGGGEGWGGFEVLGAIFLTYRMWVLYFPWSNAPTYCLVCLNSSVQSGFRTATTMPSKQWDLASVHFSGILHICLLNRHFSAFWVHCIKWTFFQRLKTEIEKMMKYTMIRRNSRSVWKCDQVQLQTCIFFIHTDLPLPLPNFTLDKDFSCQEISPLIQQIVSSKIRTILLPNFSHILGFYQPVCK